MGAYVKMFYYLFLFFAGWALMIVILAIMALFMKGKKRKGCVSLLIWGIFPLLFPGYTKKNHLISSWWVSGLIAAFSPYFMVLLIIGFCFLRMDIATQCRILGENGSSVSTKIISWHTGVDFPKLDYVDGKYYDCFPDYSTECTMKIRGRVPNDFLDELSSSDKWYKESHVYTYTHRPDEGFVSMTSIKVNEKTGVVKIEYVDL